MTNWALISNPILAFLGLLGGGKVSPNSQQPTPSHSWTPPYSAPPLLAREWLLGNPDFANVRLSPDGRHLAYLAPWKNVLNIWVRPLPDGEPRRLTNDDRRGVANFGWSYDNRTLVYGQDNDGDENWRLFALDVLSGQSRILTSTSNVLATILAASRRYPDRMIIGLNDRDRRYHDAYVLHLPTGNRSLLFRNDGFKGYAFDDDLNLRLVFKENAGGGTTYYKIDIGGGGLRPELSATGAKNSNIPGLTDFHLTPYKVLSADDEFSTLPLHFDDTGRVLYWFDSVGRDKGALVAEDMDTGAKRIIYEPKAADVGAILAEPITGRPLSIIEDYSKPNRVLLDASLEPDFRLFDRLFPDLHTGVVSTSLDFRFWLVTTSSDRRPARYYLYDRTQGEHGMKFLFSYQAKLENSTLASMHPREILVADGLKQVCYLTLPVELDPKNTGKPNRPAPMVLSVHGGPWSRDVWGLNGETQLLANRGYAVLQCNFRGSVGYGKAFLNAGNGQWGGKMQQDLTDAVQWAVREQIADPRRVAIMGGSYGGYATLAGLAFTPDLYACGIDIVGPTNLVTLLKSIPPYWKPLYESLKHRVGADPDTEEGRAFLERVSPLYSAEKIRKPLLIAQGANDPRVKKSESDQIVAALKKHSVPVTYLVLPDEGHGFDRPENRLAFTAVSEQFLAKCLGGRAQPIADALVLSTIQIQEL